MTKSWDKIAVIFINVRRHGKIVDLVRGKCGQDGYQAIGGVFSPFSQHEIEVCQVDTKTEEGLPRRRWNGRKRELLKVCGHHLERGERIHSPIGSAGISWLFVRVYAKSTERGRKKKWPGKSTAQEIEAAQRKTGCTGMKWFISEQNIV